MNITALITTGSGLLFAAISAFFWFMIRNVVVSVKKESEQKIEKLKLEIEKMCDEKTERVQERIDRVEAQASAVSDRLIGDEKVYLTESKHGLLCQNAQLELKAHITEVLTATKDEIFNELRAIKGMIKNGNNTKSDRRGDQK